MATLQAASGTNETVQVVAKWERFEITLKSSVTYTNPIQQAELDAWFISPEGVTNRALGFWDGERTWRVRFAPDIPGRWKFFTRCSDAANSGLNNQSGSFTCTAATTKTRFGQHGPLQVARSRRHFEHADHEPFLWLGDDALNAVRISDPEHLTYYGKIRAAQNFNAVLWSVAPGIDEKNEAAFTGDEMISINVDFFQRLDAKVVALNRQGLLNAIAPFWDIGEGTNLTLSASQTEKLLRYVVARWNADNVAWVLAFESENNGLKTARWKYAGQSVFGETRHSPVIIFPGDATWVLDDLRGEKWVDAFGFSTVQAVDESALPWLLNGPLALERRKEPARPLVTLMAPPENLTSKKSVSGEQSRRLLWWTLLADTPAGVSYSSREISNWRTNLITMTGESKTIPAWQRALILPGAFDIGTLHQCFKVLEFWRLRPFPIAVAEQPGDKSPQQFIVAAGSEERDFTVLYSPNSSHIAIIGEAMPKSAQVEWLDPRSGRSTRANAIAEGTTLRFKTPGDGDWFLVMRSGKGRNTRR